MTEWIYLQRKTHCYLTPYVEVVGKVYSDTAKKVWFGKSIGDFFVTYTKGVMTWYSKKEAVDDLFPFVSSKIIENPSYLKKIFDKFIPEIKKLIELSEKINKKNFEKLGNEELWDLYNQYIDFYEIASIYGEPVPLVTKDIVVDHIKKQIKKDISNEKGIINELVSILTTPFQKSFIRKEEEDFLKIGQIIQENDKLLNIFKEKSPDKINNELENSDIYKKIVEHQKKYCWIPYDYGVQIWDVKYFITALKNIVSSKRCKEELKIISSEQKRIQLKQESFIKKYNIPKDLQDLFEYVRLATYMMDYKKELFTKSHYLIIPMIDEIAGRLNTNHVLVRFMRHADMKNGLLNNKVIPEKELKERYELGVCLWDKEGNTRFLQGKKASEFIEKNIQDNPETKKGTKLHGTCACVGRYRGRAKIVMSAMHITKVEKGDVLIAPMTSPDYVVGMKNAGAIVTDEGGITCHAAIVSRELKIPCVVGTEKATKIFKDGDLVEVNANHASIRLLEK